MDQQTGERSKVIREPEYVKKKNKFKLKSKEEKRIKKLAQKREKDHKKERQTLNNLDEEGLKTYMRLTDPYN